MKQELLQPVPDGKLEAMDEAVTCFQAGPQAMRILAARGFDPETVESARLGFVADSPPGYEQYRGMLCIPYLLDGKPVQLRFRCAGQHDGSCHEAGHAKYRTVAGERSRPYNVSALNSTCDTLHITEGELDSLILQQCGLNSIALPGATQWKPHYKALLAGFTLVLWGDPDSAGQEFNQRIQDAFPRAKVARLTAGDVNETYLQDGEFGIYQLSEGAS